jgi:hypothetical protein
MKITTRVICEHFYGGKRRFEVRCVCFFCFFEAADKRARHSKEQKPTNKGEAHATRRPTPAHTGELASSARPVLRPWRNSQQKHE